MFDDVLVKFDSVWGGNELIYHTSNDRIVWHIRVPYVSLANHF